MNPMNLAPRCLAKTRRATLCQSPAIRGKKRCRLHGGAKGSGAPKGNKNALKHGKYTSKSLKTRNERKQYYKIVRAILAGTIREEDITEEIDEILKLPDNWK